MADWQGMLPTTIMATLYAVEAPMAWHKTRITWVGFNVNAKMPAFKLANERTKPIGPQ